MTNLQLYLAVGLPVIAVLASMVVSLVQISGIRDDVREIRGDVRGLRGEVNSKIDVLRGEVNAKIDLLTGKVYEMIAKH